MKRAILFVAVLLAVLVASVWAVAHKPTAADDDAGRADRSRANGNRANKFGWDNVRYARRRRAF